MSCSPLFISDSCCLLKVEGETVQAADGGSRLTDRRVEIHGRREEMKCACSQDELRFGTTVVHSECCC